MKTFACSLFLDSRSMCCICVYMLSIPRLQASNDNGIYWTRFKLFFVRNNYCRSAPSLNTGAPLRSLFPCDRQFKSRQMQMEIAFSFPRRRQLKFKRLKFSEIAPCRHSFRASSLRHFSSVKGIHILPLPHIMLHVLHLIQGWHSKYIFLTSHARANVS